MVSAGALQLLARIRLYMTMAARVLATFCASGPSAAFGWITNAKRLRQREALSGRHYYLCVRTQSPVVPAQLAAAIKRHFDDSQRQQHPFAQEGQDICYKHDFPQHIMPELLALYESVRCVVNEADPNLQLQPIKSTFAERVYAINYPGPVMRLPFHYDCNDESDFKVQLLLEKSPGAPSLSYVAGKACTHSQSSSAVGPIVEEDVVADFEEDVTNVCVFKPHSTFHGIREGKGWRKVLMMTFTRTCEDRRQIVCHTDLVSKDWKIGG